MLPEILTEEFEAAMRGSWDLQTPRLGRLFEDQNASRSGIRRRRMGLQFRCQKRWDAAEAANFFGGF